MIDHYDWAGRREAMLRFGPGTGPVVVVAMPLLEEWNRTRAFVVTLLRALADRNIASVLPDLPGHGESLQSITDARLSVWRDAFASACAASGIGRPLVATASIRAGALVDVAPPVAARWRLSPSTGLDVVRELGRTWRAAMDARHPEHATYRRLGSGSLVPCAGDIIEIAGNRLHNDLLVDLDLDEALESKAPIRVVRLAGDPRAADRRVEAAPLWRRAEPGNDPALAALLADDIAAWVQTCAA